MSIIDQLKERSGGLCELCSDQGSVLFGLVPGSQKSKQSVFLCEVCQR